MPGARYRTVYRMNIGCVASYEALVWWYVRVCACLCEVTPPPMLLVAPGLVTELEWVRVAL